MSNPLDNERLQFFLRHRDDIKQWAAIERDVTAATREILAELLPVIEERARAIESEVEVIRHDGGKYERILVRRPSWPNGVGIALEWETGVDPFGSSVPKFGIFFLPRDGGWVAAHRALDSEARASAELRVQGYKTGDNTWPVTQFKPKSASWWQDLDGWTSPLVDGLVATWPHAALMIDGSLLLH